MPNEKQPVVIEQMDSVQVPPEFYERSLLGVPVLDEMFGGTDTPGITPGTTVMLTGTPGGGKSTIALQWADLFQRESGLNVLYNIGEESKFIAKIRADRIGLRQKFCISQIDDADELLRVAEELGVEVVFQDSMQAIRVFDQGVQLTKHRALKELVVRCRKFSERTRAIVFLVGHVVKTGGFAGPEELKHGVDVHAHLRISKETGGRILQMEKNRIGPSQIPYEFALSANGVDFSAISEVPPPPGAPSAREARKGQVLELIRGRLMAGEEISGYCFERLGADVSGGFWRTLLHQACERLRREGFRIGERREGPAGGGRLHYFIDVDPQPAPAGN